MRFFLLLTAILFFPLVVLAQAASLPTVDVTAAASGLAQAFTSHNWLLVAAFVLMLLVWAAGRFNFLSFLPAKAVPWVAVTLGALFAMATGLTTGVPLLDSLVIGVKAGLAAVGTWETVGKAVLPPPTTATPPSVQ